ncbi:MAG: SPFH domain-containing protein [Clostridiales bacterium]|nr:SPFH domain-containing protein [Clostridiales bacterium]
MGLISAALGSVGGTLSDQWKEFFYLDSMTSDVLAAKAKKRAGKRSSNTKGDENIISNGSVIAVNDGQCMMIVEQGRVVDVCAEPGEYVYDQSTEPSIFTGGLGKGIIDTFKTIGKRFAFGGEPGKDQRVYYFNLKEIMGNKYGTVSPVPFRVVDQNIGLDVDISIRCNGEYSYQIMNPLLFYQNVCGNVSGEFARSQIDSQLKSELLTALQPAFAKLSDMGIRYSALPGHTMELADALNDVLTQKWQAKRGVKVASFGVNSVTASKEDEEMIKNLQKSAVFRDPTMSAANLSGAQADAMRLAANNPGGAMAGFMGLNMAQQAGGINANDLYAMGNQRQQQQPANKWKCSCGATNTGKFCSECGKPRPAAEWTCPECGAVNTGKFCAECGKPRE